MTPARSGEQVTQSLTSQMGDTPARVTIAWHPINTGKLPVLNYRLPGKLCKTRHFVSSLDIVPNTGRITVNVEFGRFFVVFFTQLLTALSQVRVLPGELFRFAEFPPTIGFNAKRRA